MKITMYLFLMSSGFSNLNGLSFLNLNDINRGISIYLCWPRHFSNFLRIGSPQGLGS